MERNFDNVRVREILQSLIETLQSKYVFPDIAEKLKEKINKDLSSGFYDSITSLPELCSALTTQLQDISHDKHMIVEYSEQPLPSSAEDKRLDIWEPYIKTIEEYNYGFMKIERLPGNIGYIDLKLFYPPYMAAETCNAAMTFLSKTNAMILDLRSNAGGESEMVATLLSYFFPPKPILLDTFYFREGDRMEQSWTLPTLPGPRYLNKPLYVLTNSMTFSAAEECAYDLQQLKRGTIIGEVTYGGAHPVESYRLEDHVQVFVPNGRVINPVTGTDWEGVGVKPDITVPGEEAFSVAYNMALEHLYEEFENKYLTLSNLTLNEIKEKLKKKSVLEN